MCSLSMGAQKKMGRATAKHFVDGNAKQMGRATAVQVVNGNTADMERVTAELFVNWNAEKMGRAISEHFVNGENGEGEAFCQWEYKKRAREATQDFTDGNAKSNFFASWRYLPRRIPPGGNLTHQIFHGLDHGTTLASRGVLRQSSKFSHQGALQSEFHVRTVRSDQDQSHPR